MIGVYKITNPEGQVYVGASTILPRRFKYYRSVSSKNQVKIYNSIQKHGYDNHVFEILEECPIELLKEREGYWGSFYNVLSDFGLNGSLPKGEFISMGVNSDIRKGRSLRMQNENNHFYGKRHSEEVKEILRMTHLGKKHTIEHRQKVSQNHAKCMAKLVVNLETGIFYESCSEAARSINAPISTLKSRLNGSLINNTPFRYCEKIAQ